MDEEDIELTKRVIANREALKRKYLGELRTFTIAVIPIQEYHVGESRSYTVNRRVTVKDKVTDNFITEFIGE